ncbi:hypothetical protein ACWD45_11980 [Streptomyces rubiginosohelvolus]
MEIAELVLKYVETLVWPIAVCGLVWRLRHSIKAAIARLSRLETPAGTMEFTEEARDIREDAEVIAVAGATESGGVTPVGDSPPASADTSSREEEASAHRVQTERREQLDEIFDGADLLAHQFPAGAVTTAWEAVESLRRRLARERGIPSEPTRRPDGRVTVTTPGGTLIKMGVADSTRAIYKRLWMLWRTAVRDPDSVGVKAARDFVRSCRTVADSLQQETPDALSGTPGPP